MYSTRSVCRTPTSIRAQHFSRPNRNRSGSSDCWSVEIHMEGHHQATRVLRITLSVDVTLGDGLPHDPSEGFRPSV
jgi:hypothetical protein